MTIRVAADGSALGNPGPAGWAWYVDDGCWGAGGWKHATNNQGELTAVLEFLRATKHLDDDLLILCDSQYVIKCITEWMPGWKRKGWRKADGKPVMNLDILKQLDEELKGRTYRFEWVKGHANHPLNEAADERARAVSEAYQRGQAIPSGPGWTRDGDTSHANNNSAPKAAPEAASAPAELFEQPSLFALDEPPAATPATRITLDLSEDELAKLRELAAERGLGLTDALRSLL